MKKILTLLVIVVALFSMAIALDLADTNVTDQTGVSSISWAHACTGSNLMLWIGVQIASDTTDLVNSVTYNGSACTRATTVTGSVDGRVYLYYIVAPTTGSNTVFVGTSSAPGRIRGLAVSYTGCAQTGQPDATGTNTFSGVSSGSVSCTVVAANSWMIMVQSQGTAEPTAGSGTTRRGTSSGGGFGLFDSNGALSAGSNALNWSLSGNGTGQAVAASFSPFVGGATVTAGTSRLLTGVGS